MKKLLITALAAGLLAGCFTDDNQLRVTNRAAERVIFHFRGSSTEIASGTALVVTDVPKGTYEYSTTFGIPAGLTGAAGEGLSGVMTFSGDTKSSLVYSNNFTDSTYIVDAVFTTSEEVRGGEVTAP